METKINYLQWTMDDIVFDNRNKAYGAYQLRQDKDKHLRTGLLLCMFLCVLFVVFSKLEILFGKTKTAPPEVLVALNPKEVSIVKPFVAPPVTKPETKAASGKKWTEIAVRKEGEASSTESLTRVNDLASDHISDATTEGSGEAVAVMSAGTDAITEPSTEPVHFADVNPEFPGGDQALIRFLQAQVQYPASELAMGVEGKVLLRFVVMEDGAVSNVQVIRSVSAGLDKEAVRVVKMLPKFKPGKQHGQSVKVYFNLPVVFKIR